MLFWGHCLVDTNDVAICLLYTLCIHLYMWPFMCVCVRLNVYMCVLRHRVEAAEE